jgi:DNA-binding transcriptional regulator YhcF (GntR family)
MKKKSIKKNLKKKVKSSYETHDLGHETELPHRRKTSKNHEVKFSTIKKK